MAVDQQGCHPKPWLCGQPLASNADLLKGRVRERRRVSSTRFDVSVFLSKFDTWEETVFSLITRATAMSR